MNTARHLTPATLIAAVFAAAALLHPPLATAAPAAPVVVKLPTVHVVAKRSALPAASPMVVQLPTVHVIGRRSATLLAAAAR